jgi:hypothetical protein
MPEIMISRLQEFQGCITAGSGSVAPQQFPHCAENHALPKNASRRMEPVPDGAMFVPIPVRIIVDTAGRVKHVHVIRAGARQRRAIKEALHRWTFKPYQLNGRTVEIETGLVFRFTPKT